MKQPSKKELLRLEKEALKESSWEEIDGFKVTRPTSMKSKSKSSKKTKIDFLDGNLSEFIADGGWQLAKFELSEKKDRVLSLRLSEKLLTELKKQAKSMGLDTQDFIRISLENVVRRKA